MNTKQEIAKILLLLEEMKYLAESADMHKSNRPLRTAFLQRAKDVLAEVSSIEDRLHRNTVDEM